MRYEGRLRGAKKGRKIEILRKEGEKDIEKGREKERNTEGYR